MGKSKEIQKKKAASGKKAKDGKKKWGGTGQGKSGRGSDDNVVFNEKQWNQFAKTVPHWKCITISKVMQTFNIQRCLAKAALEKLCQDDVIMVHHKHSKLMIYVPYKEEEEEEVKVVANAEEEEDDEEDTGSEEEIVEEE